MEKLVETLEDLDREAAAFVRALTPRKEGAALVTLSGELGAGKTAFAQAIACALGVRERVPSPTFVLMRSYTLPSPSRAGGFARLVHIDAYRLRSVDDLAPLAFPALLGQRENLILFEWPEHVARALPQPAARVSLTARPDGSRILSYG